MVSLHAKLAAIAWAVPVAFGSDPVKLCPSPGGYHPCECLHEVDSETRIDEVKDEHGKMHAVLNFPNGTNKVLDECPHKRPKPPHWLNKQSYKASADTNPCQLGWAHAAPLEAFYQHSKDILQYNATYTVPEPPSDASTNILYYWIGLQDLGSEENPVIQPVLSWVKGSEANNWYFESWNCCPAGHKLKSISVPIEGAGTSVFGHMARDTNGLWSIISKDSTERSSVLYSNDTASGIVRNWNWVEIVLETYNVDSCSDYSAGGQAQFLDMKLIDTEGQSVTPSWTMNPYINGEYLSASESAQFTACCNGTFDLEWPSAAMHQNGATTNSLLV